jgi:uncharacterized protein YjbJ (UPF0337 family)
MGGLMDKVKGKIKQTAGTLTGNKELKAEGKSQVVNGEIKGAAANGKKAVNHAVKK